MKSAAAPPCSRTLLQTYAQAEPSTHTFGMVKDCALRSSKPRPIAIAAAAATAKPLLGEADPELERLLAEEEEIERRTREHHETPHFRGGED